ncbi:hypothetical protein V502_06408 [Pseudogymnoascus sp. VKM F-4520 (FW-2644)]|nr:hypothetical protein V502_06408 [Pseudogymnoascus sp. VKM F-4520 (FW-2644)]
MGEQFQIAAPLAKRALKYKGMLGVILFNSTPHNLVSLLLVPTKSAQQPASPAATAAPTKPQIGSSSLDATCPSPSPSAAAIAVGHPQQHAGSGAKRDPWDIFCTLPVEIHALIFANLDDLADLTCVGATEPYLWGITQEIVQQRYSSLFGSWAGEKIVCAGDKSNPGDYPPGLYSAEEEEDLKKMFLVRMYDSADDYNLDYISDSDDDYERTGTLWAKRVFSVAEGYSQGKGDLCVQITVCADGSGVDSPEPNN